MHFKALSIGHQNEQISSDFLLGFKRATFGGKYQFFQTNAVPFSASLWKIIDFKENGLFQEDKQNEQISVILSNFQKRALYRLQFLHRKLSIFIKWPVSRDSLPPFGVII